ncbi:hypothetical protein BOTU111921_07860 [Bordetella tumbae]
MDLNPPTSAGAQPSALGTKPLAAYSDSEVRAEFFDALEDGNINLCLELYAHPAIHGEIRNGQGETMLHVAIRSGHTMIARRLTQECDGAVDYLDAIDDHGYTPLMLAVRLGQLELVDALLEAGASADVPLTEQRAALVDEASGKNSSIVPSALHLAVHFRAYAENSDDVQKGKDMIASLTRARADCADALMRSISMGTIKATRILINELKADPSRAFYHAAMAKLPKTAYALQFLGADGIADLAAAAQRGDERSIGALLGPVLARNIATAVNTVAATGDIAAVQSILLDRGIYSYAVRQAIKAGKPEIVKVLIEAAVTSPYEGLNDAGEADAAKGHTLFDPIEDDNPPDTDKYEELVEHTVSGNLEALTELSRARIYDADALTYFAETGNADKGKVLLNVHRGETIGLTALAQAIVDNKLDSAKALISVGANGEKLLMQTINGSNVWIAMPLIDLGVDLSAALMYAVESKSQRAVDVLCLLGAEFPDALLCAAKRENTAVAKTLIATGSVNVADIVELVELARNSGDERAANFLLSLNNPIGKLSKA